MAIVAMDKLTVYGASDQKDAALDALQELGCLHLVSLKGGSTPPPELVSREARQALRYLKACPTQRKQTERRAGYDRQGLIDEVLAIEEQCEQLVVERDELRQAIQELEPWGDFRLPDSEDLGGKQFWFYAVPLNRASELPADLPWRVATHDARFAYIVVLADRPPPSMGFKPLDLDRRPLSVLRERLEAVDEELEDLHWRRVTLTRWRTALQDDLDAADDKAARFAAAEDSLDDDYVFALRGWVPCEATPDVRRLAQEYGLAITIEAPGQDDSVPTLLYNPQRVAGAEGCVTFYITPGYNAWDPTTVVFFSFSIFFAMIVADAGYGMVMAAILFLLNRKLRRTPSGIRSRSLMAGIVCATVVYGVIVGSYFGVEPAQGTLLDAMRVRINGAPMMSNQDAMMVIAVAIGVCHLSLGNVISAWQHRGSPRCLGRLGWAAVMLGVFLFGAARLAELAILKEIGGALAIAGAAAILVFSSHRPLTTWNFKTHLGRLLDGLMQFANLSKAFGDALSYLRLFALGLASAKLAVTFNELAAGASASGGVGILLALLILTVGHGINFLLGIMGGVVHGLRLNCIEFFNWSLTDEGFPFQPFRKKATA